MSIKDNSDWSAIELRAQTHELALVETPTVPQPTQAQQLLWVSQRAAELQARLLRKNAALAAVHMYLSIGAFDRAQQEVNRALLDL